jgi:hypothetical protein
MIDRLSSSCAEPGGVGISGRPRLLCQRHLNGSEYADSIIFILAAHMRSFHHAS